MTAPCAFCGRTDCATIRSRLNPPIATCESCARATLRQFGDFVQGPASVVSLTARRFVGGSVDPSGRNGAERR